MTSIELESLRPVILDYARQMKLPTVGREYEALAKRARSEGMDPVAYLHTVLEAEYQDRQERRTVRRVKEARFPQVKTLSSFDFKRNPSLDEAHIRTLANCEFVREGRPVLFIGGTGTGKTHLATALGYEACSRGHAVKFVTAAALVNELTEARESRDLSRVVGRYARTELLVLDELGYLPLSPEAAQLLFQVIAERGERRATIITTNLPFSEWTSVIADPRLCRAFVERVTYRAHIVDSGEESVRLGEMLKLASEAREGKGGAAKS